MEHELTGPEPLYAEPPLDTPPEIIMAGPDDHPGGLYDDAAALADDVTDLDATADLDASSDFDASAELDASADLDIDGSLLDTIEQELADVERALAMLDEGTYGQCDHCGHAIDDELLVMAPTTRFCAEHLPLSLR